MLRTGGRPWTAYYHRYLVFQVDLFKIGSIELELTRSLPVFRPEGKSIRRARAGQGLDIVDNVVDKFT